LAVGVAEAAAIAHQAAGLGELTVWKYGGQPAAGSQHRDLFHPPGEEGAVADHDRTNMLLREGFEGLFEISIGSSIRNNELQTERARGRLHDCDRGLDIRKGRVRENAKPGNIGHQIVGHLQSFRR
jgi:hypothetical protein